MFFKSRRDKEIEDYMQSEEYQRQREAVLNEFLASHDLELMEFYDSEEYENIKRLQEAYYSQLEKIQEAWSVLYNLKAYDSEMADQFESACMENIRRYHEMRKAEEGTPVEDDHDLSVPAYTRLAMLYERRKDYDAAIETCVASIRAKGVKGEYARLARMIKKSEKPIGDDVMALLDQK